MKPQMLYRGGENKKERLTKVDKVYIFVQKMKRREEARKKQAATAA